MYLFYLIFMEMVFYVEDRKVDDGKYYIFDLFYSFLIICKCFIFFENNKYLVIMCILVIVIFLIFLVYYFKLEIYYFCNCFLKLFNDDNSFFDVENFYKICLFEFVLGVIYFIIVIFCVFFNLNGGFDDFILFDFINLWK